MANNANAAPENEIRIVLLGKTGVGKSLTGNTILGGPQYFDFGSDANSVTRKCSWQTANRFDAKLDVVDTPGVFDTDNKACNDDVQNEIARCITLTSPGPQAILLCVKMGRFTKEDLATLKHFMKHFGEELLKFTIVVFTQVDQWEEDYKRKQLNIPARDTYMQNLPDDLRNFIILCKSRVLFVNNRLMGVECETLAQEIISNIRNLIATNGNECYTNENYREVEQALTERTTDSNNRDEIKTSSEFFEYAKTFIRLAIYAIKQF